jgi:hypothetical protein
VVEGAAKVHEAEDQDQEQWHDQRELDQRGAGFISEKAR